MIRSLIRILSRDESNDSLTLLQQYLMLFDTRISECNLPCTLINHLTISIEEPDPFQPSIIRAVEEEYLPDVSSNLLQSQVIIRFQLTLFFNKGNVELIVIRSIKDTCDVVV